MMGKRRYQSAGNRPGRGAPTYTAEEKSAPHDDIGGEGQPVSKKQKMNPGQQARLQEYLDTLPGMASEMKRPPYTIYAPKVAKRPEKLPPTSALETMIRKYEREHSKLLAEMTEVGNLRCELKLAKECCSELELAIRELGDEAEKHETEISGLETKLANEQKAASLGWKLLWSQKRHTEDLEQQVAAHALLQLRQKKIQKKEQIAASALLELRSRHDHNELARTDQHSLSKLCAATVYEFPNLLANRSFKQLYVPRNYAKKLEIQNTGLTAHLISLHEVARQGRQENELLRVLNDQAVSELDKSSRKIEQLEQEKRHDKEEIARLKAMAKQKNDSVRKRSS